MNRIGLFARLAVLGLVLLASGGVGRAADDTLPGGTAISVTIDQPPSGSIVVVPPGGTATVNVSGTASIGAQPPPAGPGGVTLFTIIDDSGSVRDGGFCGGDANGDGASNTVLDCEIAAAMSLNDAALQSQAVSQVGVGVFAGDSAALDLNPDPNLPCALSASAQQGCFVSPAADANGNNVQDVDEALASIFPTSCSTQGMQCGSDAECGAGAHCTDVQGQGFCFCDQRPHVTLFSPFQLNQGLNQGTDYAGAIARLCFVAKASANSNVIAVFMSDGLNTQGNDVSTVLPCANPAVTFYTFAIGTNSSCTSDPAGLGSLQEIAARSGGTCTHIIDPAMLPQVLNDVLGSQLTGLAISVDAGPLASITNVSPALPQAGPAGVQYQISVNGLEPDSGSHGICVFASGRDLGGAGFVRECIDVSVTACGNGVVETGEQCDDGNQVSDDCCSATCQAETADAVCDADANLCTLDQCDGAGGCVQVDTIQCTALDQCHVPGTCNPASGVCDNPNKPNGFACSDGDECTQPDVCTDGVCVGNRIGADTDADGYCDAWETKVGCNPNDFYETPPQGLQSPGSPGPAPGQGLMYFAVPGGRRVQAATDPSCASLGVCGPTGFCTAGKISDPCDTAADCHAPQDICRVVVNYANAASLTLPIATLNRRPIDGFLPAKAGCSRKVDVSLDPSRIVNRLFLKAGGVIHGRPRFDRDRVSFWR